MTYGLEGSGKGKGHPPNYYPVRTQVLEKSPFVLILRAHSKGEEHGWICLDRSEAACGLSLRPK